MDLADLPLFLAVTRHGRLQAAAEEVHRTPSALSRAIRRLETSLRTPLFDRQGRHLRLNADGERLRLRALALMDLAEQTRAEFRGSGHRVHCRIAAPAVLAWAYAEPMAGALDHCGPQASLALVPAYEDDALARLGRGDVELALVSGQALAEGRQSLAESYSRHALGSLNQRVACGPTHPLSAAGTATLAELLQADFVAPTRSPFGGLPRRSGADGWRDDQLPRRVRYWVDELQVLVDLVRAGRALAYLPEFVISRAGLRTLSVPACPYRCTETAWLLWRPSEAAGWLHRYVDRWIQLMPPADSA